MGQELDYELDLIIDEGNLEQEWLEQPQRLMTYSKAAADAEAKAKRASEATKTTRSRLWLKIAANPELITGKSPVAIQEAWVRTQPEFIAARKKEIHAQHEADVLRNAVFAFQNRKAALEHLVQLYSMAYFSQPNGKVDTSATKERVKMKMGKR